MTNYQNLETDLPRKEETAQVELLESIETLQATLHRCIPLLNSESIETAKRATLALEEMHRGIPQILANRRFRNGQNRLECWENEGGGIGYDAE